MYILIISRIYKKGNPDLRLEPSILQNLIWYQSGPSSITTRASIDVDAKVANQNNYAQKLEI